MNKKYYNNFIYLIAFFIIGIIFKRNHWPLSGFIMAITSMVSIVGFVIISIHTLITIKDNKFLKYFGFIINIILALSFMGLLFKLMHWPGGDFFAYSGTIAFLISVMSLTFTLPNANYIEWTKFHKKLFYKAIIIPMVFVFIITSLTTVFPKTWDNIFFSGSKHAWNMKNIDLFEKEGLD